MMSGHGKSDNLIVPRKPPWNEKLWGQACYFAISRIVLPHVSETTTPLSRSIVPRYLAG
jgi:hypothetical protein